MGKLGGMRVAVLVADGFEQAELDGPVQAMRDAGLAVDVLAPDAEHHGHVVGVSPRGEARGVKPDRLLVDADPKAYDALLVPGGASSAEAMRTSPAHVEFVRSFAERRKPIAAFCHALALLAEADLLRGRTVTAWPVLRDALERAGARWIDREVAVDGKLVTGRRPNVPALSRTFVDLLQKDYELLSRPWVGDMEVIDGGAVQLETGRPSAESVF